MIYKLLGEQAQDLVQVYHNRGLDIKHYPFYSLDYSEDSYINDYNLLGRDNLINMAKTLLTTIKNNKKAIIIVDSDADGFCSASLILNYLHNYFPNWVENNVDYFFHEGKQHGLEDCCDYIISNQYDLVIAPDSSSNDYDQHKKLFDNNIKIIILDHHEAEKIPQNVTILNNQLSEYPNKFMCGGGIVWQFCRYMSLELFNDKTYLKFLDLVALSLISDMMDVKEPETAYLIQLGIQNKNLKNPFIYYLSQRNAYSLGANPTPLGWAFYITPFLNSMNRTGTMEEKILLFKSMLDYEAFKMIPSTKRGAKGQDEKLVEQAVRTVVNVKNRQTKLQDEGMEILEKKIKTEDLLKNKVLIFLLEPNEIASGLAGLAGNKIMNKYQRPCCVLTKNEKHNLPWDCEAKEEIETTYSGSARGCSVVGVDTFKDVCNNFPSIIYAQGHQGAFGLSLPADTIQDFIDYTNDIYKDIPNEPIYYVDAVWNENNINDRLILDIGERGYMWGTGMPEPIIAIENIKITPNMINIYEKMTNTLKITLNNISLMKFRITKEDYDIFNEVPSEGYIKVTFIGKCMLNEFNGQIKPQIEIIDYDLLTVNKYDF